MYDPDHIPAPLGSDPLERPMPPAEAPGQTPHPGKSAAPRATVPMTDGTPAACRQKNAQEFLAGRVPGVMAEYAPGLFSFEQKLDSAQPAPDDDGESVRRLVRWREQSPYG